MSDAARLTGGPGDGLQVPVPAHHVVNAATGQYVRTLWPVAGVFCVGDRWLRYVHEGDGVYRFDADVTRPAGEK